MITRSAKLARDTGTDTQCVEARRTSAEAVEVWSTGKASREFLYVDDCADAIVRAAEKYDDGEPVNIGAGSEIRIAELARLIARLTGFAGKVCWQTDKPDSQPRRSLDVSRAREKFGFEAKTSFEDGLKHTILWYEEQHP